MSSLSHPMGRRPSYSLSGGPLRLTRRGRLVLLGLAAALAFLLLSVGDVAAHAFGLGEPATPPSTTYVVQPGQTLWSIAEDLEPAADPRETVARIVAMNDLPSSSVVAGQQLEVPR